MISHREVTAMALVEIVELKWLLTGEGVHLHVERLQSDPEYARQILDRAAASKTSTLRNAAARVRRGLQLNTG
jgi:cell division protein FtsL